MIRLGLRHGGDGTGKGTHPRESFKKILRPENRPSRYSVTFEEDL